MPDRHDDRYVDSDHSTVRLRAWAFGTVDMGGWTGTDRDAFREAIQAVEGQGIGGPEALADALDVSVGTLVEGGEG